jgi:hypothetical protein
VGITSESRISSLIASAGMHIPDAVWDELEQLVPPASTWLDHLYRGRDSRAPKRPSRGDT